MRSQFEYFRPTTPEEAVALKSQYGGKAAYWAGGTDMLLNWQRSERSPEFCIDLTFLDGLRGIRVGADQIRIGAMSTLTDLERSAGRHRLLKTLSDIAKLMCTPQTRTLATIGGNLCNASPAADLSPAFVAMEALAVMKGTDEPRRVSMLDFFEGVNRTALRDAELLEEILIPLPRTGGIAASYRRIDRTAVDIALVNASSCLETNAEGVVARCSIALGAVAPVIVRCPDAESLIAGRRVDALDSAALAEAGDAAVAAARPISDVRASAGYRRDMVAVMVRRSLADCVEQLRG